MAGLEEEFDQLAIDDHNFAQKKPGNEGYWHKVKTNFTNIRILEGTVIYQYNVEIEVRVSAVRVVEQDAVQDVQLGERPMSGVQEKAFNFRLFKKFFREHKEDVFQKTDGSPMIEPVFDGRKKVFYTRHPINLNHDTYGFYEMTLPKRPLKTFQIHIFTPDAHEINLSSLNATAQRPTEKERELQALELIISYGTGITTKWRRRNRLGFHQHVKLTESGVQLNVDKTATVFCEAGKLIDLVERYLTEKRFPKKEGKEWQPVLVDDSLVLSSKERLGLSTELRGLEFELEHIVRCPRSPIRCLTEQPISELYFREQATSRWVSVKQYFDEKYAAFFEQYGRKVYGNLPAVQSGKGRFRRYYPMEVVRIKTLAMTRFGGQQDPLVRFEKNEKQISNLVNMKRYGTNFLKEYGISLVEKFVEVDARLLEAPILNGTVKKKLKMGAWRLTDFVPAALPDGFKWMVVNFSREAGQELAGAASRGEVDRIVVSLIKTARKSGLKLEQPDIKYMEQSGNLNLLRIAFRRYMNACQNLGLLLFIFPKNDELYSNIKFLSELEFGIATQCVVYGESKVFGDPTYFRHLKLKINSKLGGIKALLDEECKIGHLKEESRTMIMGLNVSQSIKSGRHGNSIVSVVATCDSHMVNYYSKCVLQPESQLEIVELESITKEVLANFRASSNDPPGFYPDHVLVYRNGLLDSQFDEVIGNELLAMKNAFAAISKELQTRCNPKITFIVAQRRHHTRFLPVDERDRDMATGNAKPGMVVDNTVVSNYYFDFYLSAHPTTLGTTSPTRYIVFYDESAFTGDDLQKSTYFLSHLYSRCTNVVSAPPPVLYCDLLVKHAKSYLHILSKTGDLHDELNPEERAQINRRIAIKPCLQNTLYFV